MIDHGKFHAFSVCRLFVALLFRDESELIFDSRTGASRNKTDAILVYTEFVFSNSSLLEMFANLNLDKSNVRETNRTKARQFDAFRYNYNGLIIDQRRYIYIDTLRIYVETVRIKYRYYTPDTRVPVLRAITVRISIVAV